MVVHACNRQRWSISVTFCPDASYNCEDEVRMGEDQPNV